MEASSQSSEACGVTSGAPKGALVKPKGLPGRPWRGAEAQGLQHNADGPRGQQLTEGWGWGWGGGWGSRGQHALRGHLTRMLLRLGPESGAYTNLTKVQGS